MKEKPLRTPEEVILDYRLLASELFAAGDDEYAQMYAELAELSQKN